MTAYIEQGIVSAQQMQLSNTVVTSRLLKQSTNSSCSMKNLIFETASHQSTLKKFEAVNKVHGKTVVFYKK